MSPLDKTSTSCRDIIVENVNHEDGLKLLIDKLKKLYVTDSKASAYLAYQQSESFQRPSEMNITDYLNQF